MSTRVSIYVRQSQTHDDTISPALQESQCRAMADREGWTVVGVHSDIDISGTSTKKRTGLAALRKSYDAGEFDLALAHAVSRFARNMTDGAEIVAEMPLATVLEGRAPAGDDFMPLLHMLLAHKQAKEIGKRWVEVHEYRASKGLPSTGRGRLGYLWEKGAPLHLPDPATQEFVVSIYKDYAAGQGFTNLCDRLNVEGHTNSRGLPWQTTSLRKYMDSGFAAGFIMRGDTRLPGAHEAIIDEATWLRYLASRKERSKQSPRAQTATWYLARIAECGLCGGPMVIVRGGTKPTTRYAMCSRRKRMGKSTCQGVSVRLSVLDRAVAFWLGSHVEAWAEAMPDDSKARERAEDAKTAAETALQEAEAVLGRLASGWASGVLDDAGYRLARIEADAARQSAQDALDAATETLGGLLPADADLYSHIIAGGEDMSTPEWNATLKRVILRAVVNKDKSIDIEGTTE